MRKINTYAFPCAEVAPAQTCVVIDVLRATSTIAAALAAGAEAVIPVREVEEAHALRRAHPDYLLGGERGGLPIEGFELSNSPLEYTPARVAGRTIVMTTTNGTRALHAAGDGRVFICALVNLEATDRVLSALPGDINILCAGTQGRFSTDDIYTAGALIHRLGDVMPDDLGHIALAHYRAYAHDPHGALAQCAHYGHLRHLGLEADLDFCLAADTLDCVGEYRDGAVIKLPHT